MADTEERTPSELLCDLLVYAPLGFAFEAPRLVPELAAKGRNQVAAARNVGRFVVQQANDRLGPLVGSMVNNVLSTLGIVDTEPDVGGAAEEAGRKGTEAADPARVAAVVDASAVAANRRVGAAPGVDTARSPGSATQAANAVEAAEERRSPGGLGVDGAGFDPGLGGTGDAIAVPAGSPSDAPAAAGDGSPTDVDRAAVDAAANQVSGVDTSAPVAGIGAAATAERSGRAAAEQVPDVDALAIPDYDSLAASQVVPRLAALGTDELGAVRSYESAHRGRRTILGRVDQLLARSAGSGN